MTSKLTNKEKFQRTFSTLHASKDYNIMEVRTMNPLRKKRKNKLIIVCATVLAVVAMASVAYAADLGGIQRHVELWLHGDKTDAVLEIENNQYTQYTLTYEDVDGNMQERGGGGVAYDMFGNERPLTEEEIMEELNSPEVKYAEDGSVWVYYFEQKIEITDKFDEQGVCYVQLKNGNKNLYMTVKYNAGYSTSPHKFPKPEEFFVGAF